jgi:predicted alpha/beta-fold hydrolase
MFLCVSLSQSTIWPVYFRTVPASVAYWRECVRTRDAGHVTLDWLLEPNATRDAVPSASPTEDAIPARIPAPAALPPLRDDSPVVILLSGIAGGSADSYVKHFVEMSRARGMRPVCFNSRGCAGGPLTVPQFYSASFTGCACERVCENALFAEN